MPDSPHRPFVPKRTAPEKRTPASQPEFRVARPFVHGQARSHGRTEAVTEQSKPLASIADFLAMDTPAPIADFLPQDRPAPGADWQTVETSAPSAAFATAETPPWEEPPSISDYIATEAPFDYGAHEVGNDSYELPPIEHFTDAIPEEGTLVDAEYEMHSADPFAEFPLASAADEHGWEETDWQRYDWRSAAALGDAGDPAANTAWAQTDWEDSVAPARDVRETAAQAIAEALDGIARRIREGDLQIPQPPAAVPDPATIAATLAALLGVRR